MRQTHGVRMEVLFASVPVADLEAAVPWYEKIFGRPPDIQPNENEVMWRVAENAWLYVTRDAERAGRTVVTLSVTDLRRSVQDLRGRGLQPGPIEAVGEAGWKATLSDADGNAISLIEVASS